MAAWLHLMKTALPYVASIVTTAIPAFTARRADEASREEAAELTAQQISELQSAVTRNTESLKGLAAQVQKTMEAVEQGATSLESRMAQFDQALAALKKQNESLREALHREEQRAGTLEHSVRHLRAFAYAALAAATVAFAIALIAPVWGH